MQNGRVKAGAIGDRPAGGGPRAALSLIWDFWKAYAEKIAFYQTTVILSVIYAVVVGPISLIGRLVRHQFLPERPHNAGSFWHAAHMGRISGVEELKKQG